MGTVQFHPAVQEWFETALGPPTSAQRQGWASIAAGRHTLIAAPTGSGKTLAAFLTAIDGLFTEGLAAGLTDEVRVLYVSPLKALEHRHPQESRGAAAGHRPRRRGAGPGAAAHHRRGADRRHHGHRARGDGQDAAAHPGHDARVALPAADVGAQPADAAHGADGDRRRDPRRHRHAPRRASRAVARAPGARGAAAAAAHRPVGDAEADRGGGALAVGHRRRSVRHRQRGPRPADGPGARDSALGARRGHGPRGLERVLRPARRARRRSTAPPSSS